MNNQDNAFIVPLGQALKDARLVASLTVDDVAEKLNLSISTVVNIEDALDITIESKKCPSIYLRGYLANYAKLVGLPNVQEFAEYQQLTIEHKSTLQTPERKHLKEKRHSKKWFVFACLLLLVAIYLFVTLQGFFVEQPSVDKNSENTPFRIENSITDELTNAEVIIEKEMDLNGDQREEQTSVTLDDKADSSVDVTANTNISAAFATEETQAVYGYLDITAPQAPGTTSSLKQENRDEKPVNVETLKLSFAEDCWTEIFDATGKRLAFDLYTKGAQLSVKGVAPFKLKLGAPSAVEIQYQDKIVDDQYKSGSTAQFSIPQ